MGRPGLNQSVKFKMLVRLLDLPRPYVRGLLELLWEVAYENGNPVIGDVAAVEAAAEWPGEPGKLCKMLFDCGGSRAGFIEPVEGEDGVFQIHDLFDHAPEYVRKRMGREAQRVAKGKTISDLRAEAGRQGGLKKAVSQKAKGSKSKQTSAVCQSGENGKQTVANVWQTVANGDTPAPAPTPTPYKEDSKESSCRKLRFDETDMLTAQWMFSLIRDLCPGSKEPNFRHWANSIRLMRERDERSDEEIRSLFQWANDDSFWKSNILSPDKLREKWNQLIIKKENPNGSSKRTFPCGPGQKFKSGTAAKGTF
jgi:hypothetical protein